MFQRRQDASRARKPRRLVLEWLEDRRLLAAGNLDITFATDGKTALDFVLPGSRGDSQYRGVAVQADGRIVAAGQASVNNRSRFDPDFAVARYNADGSADATFGTAGRTVTDFSPAGSARSLDRAVDVIPLPDGKLLVGGFADVGTELNIADFDFALARYLPDGEIDTSFGLAGLVLTDFGSDSDQSLAMARQADGRIVLAGVSAGLAALARYDANGQLDATFGTQGLVTVDLGGGNVIESLSIQADGKLVAAVSGSADFDVARFHTNGTLDTTFAGDGVASVDFGGNDTARDVALAPDGKIVVGGSSDVGGTTDFAVARLNTNGTLDTTFNGVGRVVTPVATGSSMSDQIESLVVLSDDRIVAVGSADQIGVARYLADGSLDTTLGGTGRLPAVPGQVGLDVAIGSTGQIVIAGSQSNGDATVVQLLADGSLDPAFHGGTAVVETFGRILEQASLSDLVVQPDGKAVLIGVESFAFTAPGGGSTRFLAARVNADGTLDQTFGTNGQVLTQTGIARAGAVQADGKILVAGNTLDFSADFRITRLNANGSVDASFGTSGTVTTTVSGDDVLRDLLIQPDGRILAVGSAQTGFNNTGVSMARYNSDGSLDGSFGTGGIVVDPLLVPGSTDAVLLQPDGKIVVAGTTETVPAVYRLIRFNADGSRDNSFGDQGIAAAPVGQDVAQLAGIGLLPDGSIVAAGTSTGLLTAPQRVVVRFQSDGTLEPTFGTAGIAVSEPGLIEVTSIVVAGDGKIVVVGTEEEDFSATRYESDGSLDQTFGDGGTRRIDFAGGVDEGQAGALAPDGKLIVAGDVEANSFWGAIGVARLDVVAETCPAAGCFRFAQFDHAVAEPQGSVTLEILRIGGTTGAVSVQLETFAKTAIADVDYTETTLAINFASGQSSQTVEIPIVSDTIDEGAEKFGAILSSPTGGAVLENPHTAEVTIQGEGGNSGQPDLTYGNGGLVQVDFGITDEHVFDLALQDDGKVIAVGASDSAESDFLIARFLEDGSLDPTFGQGGLVQTDFSLSHDEALAVKIQPDGKLLVVGSGRELHTPVGGGAIIFQIAMARYLPDGRLDRTFGDNGRVLTGRFQHALDVLLLDNPEGQFLVLTDDIGVMRFNADGTLDTTFGVDGFTDVPELEVPFTMKRIQFGLQSDGKIVIGGTAELGADDAVALARLLPDGTLDASFGTGGIVKTDAVPNRDDGVISLVVQPDDKILVAGGTGSFSNDDVLLLRYEADGSLDAGYGAGGIVTTDFSPPGRFGSPTFDSGFDLALQPDGKAVVFGIADLTQDDFAVSRYRQDGSLDTSFGVGGKTAFSVGSNFKRGGAVLIQDDNKIVVGSTGHLGSLNREFTLVRFLGNDQPGILQFNVARFEVDENDPFAQILVRRTGGADGVITVDARTTTGGSATAGVDYVTTSTTLTFLAGETLKSFLIPLVDDATAEGSETVQLLLENPSAGSVLGPQNTAVLDIFDGPGAFQFSSPLFNINESGGLGSVVIQRVRGSDGAATVTFSTQDGTARANLDYQDATQLVNFADGQREATVSVPVFDDIERESIETVSLALNSPTGGAVLGSRSTSVLNIFDVEVGLGSTAGSLDPLFGDDGVRSLAIPDATLTLRDAGLQSDGKILVVGSQDPFGFEEESDFLIARFLADGSPDATFGTGGRVTVDLGGSDAAESLLVQPNGAIVVVGYTEQQLTSNFAILRLLSDGSLDTTFGNGGMLIDDFGGLHDSAHAVALQNDNRLVVAGSSGGALHRDFAIARYLPDGTLDSSFATGGKQTVDFDGHFDVAAEVAIDASGKIVVAGTAENTAQRRTTAIISGDVAIARLNTDGSFDTSFATDGRLRQDFELTGNTFEARVDNDQVTRLVIQPDGKLVVGGGSDGNFLVARFLPDGTLDPEFGGLDPGTADIGFVQGSDSTAGSETAHGLALAADGRLVLSGVSSNGFAAGRLDARGRVDVGFGATGGVTLRDLAPSEALLVQPNGTLLSVGVGLDDDFNDTIELTRLVSVSNCPEAGCFQFRLTGFAVDEDAEQAIITVTRPLDSANGPATISFATVDGTATAGVDYTAVAGTLTFADTQTTASFVIPILDDTQDEGDEQILVFLTAPTGGSVLGGQSVATLTIVDDDPDTDDRTASSFGTTVRESAGTAVISLSLSGGPAVTRTTVDVATRDGTAIAGQDYLPVSTTVVWEAGQSFASFTVPILADGQLEATENFSYFLFNPTGNARLGSFVEGVVNIRDTDPLFCTNAGDVHLPFGNQGIVTTNLGSSSSERANAIEVMTDGSFVAAGQSGGTGTVGLARYLSDGSLDTNFGSGGTVNTDIGSGTDSATALHELPDGSLLVLARSFTLASDRLALLRYLPDGTLDPTFGNGGIVLHELPIFTTTIDLLTVQADGKILVAGDAIHERGSDLAFVRFHADGSVDSTFGAGGELLVDLGSSFEGVGDLLLQADGKILASSTSTNQVIRLLPDGSLDTTWADDGLLDLASSVPQNAPIEVFLSPEALELQADGRLLIAGSGFLFNDVTGEFQSAVGALRVQSDGSLDTSYGTDGLALLELGDEFVGSLSADLQADGRLVLGADTFSEFAAFRFLSDGSVDTGFGDQGFALVSLQGGSVDLRDLAITPTGRILMGGSRSFNGQDFAFAQLVGGNSIGQFRVRSTAIAAAEDGNQVEIQIERVCGRDGATGVHVETQNGTALAGTDYVAHASDLSFADQGGTLQTITVPLLDDSIFEGNLDFNVELSNPTGGATLRAESVTTVTIVDDEQPGVLRFSDIQYFVDENDGSGSAQITVVRELGDGGPVTVDFTARADTATSVLDFSEVTQTISFANGQSQQIVNVPIVDDGDLEDDEHITLELNSPTGGAALGFLTTARLTIVDDEMPPPPQPGTIQFSQASFTAAENAGSTAITVVRSGGADGRVEVDFAVRGGSAISPLDFAAYSGTLVFVDGEITKTLNVLIRDDLLEEADETVELVLSDPTGGAALGLDAQSTLTIADDDVGLADLGLTITDSPDPVGAGGLLTYTVLVTNTSGDAAASVVLEVQLAGALQPDSVEGAICVPNGALQCTLGDLPAGARVPLTFRALVDSQASGELTSQFTITAATTDPIASNNVVDVSTTVGGFPWKNPNNALDVVPDNVIAPVDVLAIINYINANPGNPNLPDPPDTPPPFYDVSCDNLITPVDALFVINFLNAAGGEGEASGANLVGHPPAADALPLVGPFPAAVDSALGEPEAEGGSPRVALTEVPTPAADPPQRPAATELPAEPTTSQRAANERFWSEWTPLDLEGLGGLWDPLDEGS